MPLMLDPQNAAFLPIPNPGGQPPAAPPPPAQPKAPKPPPSPFSTVPGAPLIVMPHEPDDAQPTQQQRHGHPIRFNHADFIRKIEENHKDSAPGLAYADWLREQGYDKAADLYNNPHVPGSIMGAVSAQPWTQSEWLPVAHALHELQKPTLAGVINQLHYQGWHSNEVGRTNASALGYPKAGHIHLHIGGVPVLLSRFAPGVPEIAAPDSGLPTTGPARWEMKIYDQVSPHTNPRDPASPQQRRTRAVTHLTEEQGQHLLHEADTFMSPYDRGRAVQETGNRELLSRPVHRDSPVDSYSHLVPHQPEQMDRQHAPSTGVLSRGLNYPAGQFVPSDSPSLPPPRPAQQKSPTPVTTRSRLKSALAKRKR